MTKIVPKGQWKETKPHLLPTTIVPMALNVDVPKVVTKLPEFRDIGRPSVNGKAMTAAERQRRSRAKKATHAP